MWNGSTKSEPYAGKMKTIDTCGFERYSPLILAIKAIFTSPKGEKLEIVMDNSEAFGDLKDYLSEEGIKFREIYHEEKRILQFIVE